MRGFKSSLRIAIVLLIGIVSTSCAFLGKKEIPVTNYYVLDYLPATENPELERVTPFNKTLEVQETNLPRTYDRNQIVRKKSYVQISYFTRDLWSTRLYDAVPNLIVRRLNAYNIFKTVSRDVGETKPDYFLESNIRNIELVDSSKPYAFLSIELILKDSRSQTVIFSTRSERSRLLHDTSVAYLVQCFNELIMEETDLFASKCIDYFNGKEVLDLIKIAPSEKEIPPVYSSVPTETEEDVDRSTGELKVPLLMPSETPLLYEASYRDTADISDEIVTGTMNEVLMLHEGKWHIRLGSDQNISTNVDIKPAMRTVVNPFWSELIVRIIDESQTRVRMRYDIYAKTPGQDAFDRRVNTRYSPADEIGEYEYLWVLQPGNYLITVNGSSPNSYRDFTTISLEEAKSYIMTIVVDPQAERSVLVGAGLLESPVTKGKPKFHKGAVHANINLASSNSVDKDNPTQSISLSGEFDNKIDYDIWPIHFTSKSLYDLGFDKTTGTEFRINMDDYSLRNALMFYPWKRKGFLRNFGLYGRGDVNTHFFNEFAFFPENKNFIKVSQDGDSLYLVDAKKIKVKDEFYPIRLKEGMGLTYRINISTNATVNLRTGFGWQQDYENSVYYYVRTVNQGDLVYDLYHENPTALTQGLESSVVISINNLLKIFNLTSTMDVLFPMGAVDKSTIYDNENLVNIRLYRNISLDFKTKTSYNQALRDYVQTDYSAFLRLSVYY